MMTILKNILKFVTEPKNRRMLALAGLVILILLLLHQCNANRGLKNEIENQKREAKRMSNNYEAAKDTIRQYMVDDSTTRAEKLGYELTLEELKKEYSELLGDFELEKNKPPKTVIKTEYVLRDVINNIPVLVHIDANGNKSLVFSDSTKHNTNNYRFINGSVPYDVVFNKKDSVYNIVPKPASLSLELGMNLNLGLFQDKKTKKIYIKAETDYPNVTFTRLDGASIMDNDESRKVARQLRKTWGLGLNLGYGAVVNTSTGSVNLGPYFGVGLNYTPKFLQWGK